MLPEIPVMQYNKTVKDELKEGNFTKEDLLRIYRDMSVIREFETMLNLVKTTGGYNGVAYNNPGPAHLSAGQEAAAVGMAYNLTTDDFIFGSHRSHGEILAKGLRSIQILPEEELKKVMEEFWGGATVAVAKTGFKGTTKELGIRFLLYGAMAEIFARTTGFNKGLGGSMHTFFTPFGIYPNNAIVGGSGSIAVGAALYKKVNRKKGIVVANLGDGAMARGPVLEGMTFASMDQFNTLWEGDMKGGLPVLFNVMDNQYAMGGQTRGETMGYTFPARLGAGFNPEAWHAERVDGYNPLAVIDAFRRKKALLEKKEGPALLDVVTYRYSGHSPSDQSSYRTKEEIAAWEAEDCIVAYGKRLIEAGVADQAALDAIQKEVKDVIFEMLQARHRREGVPAHGPREGQRTARRHDVLQPEHRLPLRRQARRADADGGESPRQADRRQGALLQGQGRQARQQHEDVQLPRRRVRGHRGPFLQGFFPHRLR